MSEAHEDQELQSGPVPVAIIGMAARFPGADDLESFWQNLKGGVESIRFFSDEELAHVPEELRKNPNYVPACGMLDKIELFDADLFGMTPREASVTDPQQRIFLETCYTALEHAGYNPETHGRNLGVYAGAGAGLYLQHLLKDSELAASVGELQLMIGNGPDHLAPRTSYLLDLQGPSIPVQTACSTSLVAVHLACQSLINYESQMALAGGCALRIPAREGYLYVEDSIMSPDGHCRAFDARARGTVRGSGAGVVLLKRLEDALADGDTVYGVILSSAANNDGSAKVGYTAPSVRGQRRVIKEALFVGDISPDMISYVETHGTATSLGDPIEVSALTQAYGEGLEKGSIALGSVKTNIGHCDAAAGIAGLIKTVLCLKHQTLVPSLHFETPNPEIDFAAGPFYVNTQTRPWPGDEHFAAVSSFGIGGTNAHVILSGPPAAEERPCPDSALELVTLSAMSANALASRCNQLKTHLEAQPDQCFADVVHTLNVGRRNMPYRCAFAVADQKELIAALASNPPVRKAGRGAELVFLFPGQGTAYQDLGAGLYQQNQAYREAVDQCSQLLEPELGLKLVQVLFDPSRRLQLEQPGLWQPAIFVADYACARMWMAFGIQPQLMIGHSIGEYVAAVLAGVLRLEDALRLLALRGRLTAEQPGGAMLAVVRPPESLDSYILEPISLAAVNGPGLSVLSGPLSQIERIETELGKQQIRTIRLSASHAFHSAMMDPLSQPITQLARTFKLNPPQIPYYSNLSGRLINPEDLQDGSYWARHMRGTVRFSEGIQDLMQKAGRLYLESGPGNVLARLVGGHVSQSSGPLEAFGFEGDSFGLRQVFQTLGGLWSAGFTLDWKTWYGDRNLRRVPLPTYPFERNAYWHELPAENRVLDPTMVKNLEKDWYYLPCWQPEPMTLSHPLASKLSPGQVWLVFMDRNQRLSPLVQRLSQLEQKVVCVAGGEAFSRQSATAYTMRTSSDQDYGSLMNGLLSDELMPGRVLFGACLDPVPQNRPSLYFDSLLCLVKAFAAANSLKRLTVFTQGMQPVFPNETPDAEQALVIGAIQVIPAEIAGLACRAIDLDPAGLSSATIDPLLFDALGGEGEELVAWRGNQRYVSGFHQLPLMDQAPEPAFQGVYLITNGFQKAGIMLAEHFLNRGAGRVILVGKTFFPKAGEWDEWLADQGEQDSISKLIRQVRSVQAGLDDPSRIQTLVLNLGNPELMTRFGQEQGPFAGILHLNIPQEGTLIQSKDTSKPALDLVESIQAATNLRCLGEPGFLVFFCENRGEGGIGFAEPAANFAFLSAWSSQLARTSSFPVTCIHWGTRGWDDIEVDQANPVQVQLQEKRRRFGLSSGEFMGALERILSWQLPQVLVSTREYGAVVSQQRSFTAEFFQQQFLQSVGSGNVMPRPNLNIAYVAPETQTQEVLAEIWAYFFGLDKVGIHDGFFELGGHSLLAVQMLNKVRERLDVNVPVQQLFESPTVAQLAGLIDGDASVLVEEDEMSSLLAEIEGLSEEEALALLGDDSDED